MIDKKSSGVIIIDGHVQALALTRSLGELDIPVYIVDRNSYGVARFSKFCKKFFKSPDYLSVEFIPFLMELGKTQNLQNWLLLPCDDHIVKSISKNKMDLESIYKVITVDENILENIIDKRKLFELSEESGLPIIKTVYPTHWHLSSEFLLNLRFPLLVKGIEGQTFYRKTSKKAFKTNNLSELNQVLINLKSSLSLEEIMIQEMIPLSDDNKVISCSVFAIKGEVKSFWIGQKIREHPIYFGTATCSKSIYNQEVLNLAIKIVRGLSYEGVCEIEFLQDLRDNNYYIIEINPRTWLWVGLAKACGIDYAKMMYRHVHNIEDEYPQHYKEDVYWKNEITDLIFTFKDILTGKIKWKSFAKHLKHPKIKALYSTKDKKPFWAYLFLLPYIFLRR